MDDSNNKEIIGFVASNIETLREDLTAVRSQMVTKDLFNAGITSVRADVEQVQMRLDAMDHNIVSRFEHVEGELSRLRSAVYLLGKDRPEILRLLGHNGS